VGGCGGLGVVDWGGLYTPFIHTIKPKPPCTDENDDDDDNSNINNNSKK